MSSASAVAIAGTCDPGFEPVGAAFADNFARGLELGAAVAVHIEGRLVVSLWAGSAVRTPPQPWTEHTLVNIYSTTKGVSAICIQRLVDQGLLELDRPVSSYWPEFGAAGKSEITLRQVLSHQAGLAGLRERLPSAALYDHARMAAALAAAEPLWEPGTKHGYHAQTFGFLLGELVRRVTGRTLGQYLREQIAGPLGADIFIGLPEELDARVAKLTRPLGEPTPAGELDLTRVTKTEPDSWTALAFGNPPPEPGAVNTRAYRSAELPASNGHASALGLSRLYGALVAGGRGAGAATSVLSSEAVERCSEQAAFGRDEVLRMTTRFGPGFMLSQLAGPGRFGPNPRSFGHPGMGGSIAFADPDARIGFAYTMNRAGPDILVGPRPRALIDALYECL